MLPSIAGLIMAIVTGVVAHFCSPTSSTKPIRDRTRIIRTIGHLVSHGRNGREVPVITNEQLLSTRLRGELFCCDSRMVLCDDLEQFEINSQPRTQDLKWLIQEKSVHWHNSMNRCHEP
jgi:hypothetical protein